MMNSDDIVLVNNKDAVLAFSVDEIKEIGRVTDNKIDDYIQARWK